MATIEEDVLRDMYQVVRMIAAKLNRRRQALQARRMGNPQTRDAARVEELRAIIGELVDARNHDPEFAQAVDGLSDDRRTQVFQDVAEQVQNNRDRLDNDPNLAPEALDRQPDQERRDRDDTRDRERETEKIVEDRIDPNGNGEIDAVEQRQAEQAARDAEARQRQEQERAGDERRTEEARGGDVAPAVAAAGATAVVADEVLEDVDEQRETQELGDQSEPEQTQVLNPDGTAPEVIGETAAETADRQEQVQQAGLEPDGQDRILGEDGAAPAVIGEDTQQAGLDQGDREQGGPGQDGLDQNDRLEPVERREELDERGMAGPQPGFPTGGDQAAAADQEQEQERLNNDGRPQDAVETTLQEAREQRGDQVDRMEQNGQRPGMSQDEIDRMQGLQGGQASAAQATQPRSVEPVEVGAGGKNPGTRAAELRADKGSKRDGPGVGD